MIRVNETLRGGACGANRYQHGEKDHGSVLHNERIIAHGRLACRRAERRDSALLTAEPVTILDGVRQGG